MLKTVKNGSGIGVDPPPVFSKFPHFPVFFFGSVPKDAIFTMIVFPVEGDGEKCKFVSPSPAHPPASQ